MLSNEPGFGEDGKFGVQVEKIMIVETKTQYDNPGTQFYVFGNITMVPYFGNLLDLELLSSEEKDWIYERNAERR